VGGTETVRVDVRLVAATNRDLALDVKTGRFREDLYYRLNVIVLEIPPLRDRPEDVPPLVEHFVARVAERTRRARPQVADEAMAWLAGQRWPGNVRELENAVERAVVLGGEALGIADFAPRGGGSARRPDTAPAPGGDYPFSELSLEDLERLHIEKVLELCGGQKARAAAILGINRTTLWKKLRQYGVE
jgi:DNA-binding NtrC family response regulator